MGSFELEIIREDGKDRMNIFPVGAKAPIMEIKMTDHVFANQITDSVPEFAISKEFFKHSFLVLHKIQELLNARYFSLQNLMRSLFSENTVVFVKKIT